VSCVLCLVGGKRIVLSLVREIVKLHRTRHILSLAIVQSVVASLRDAGEGALFPGSSTTGLIYLTPPESGIDVTEFCDCLLRLRTRCEPFLPQLL
jgi:hypothetical protein